MIRVRFAEADDQGVLVDFIRDEWSPTHIFVDRPELFAWQHLQDDGRLNMVLAEDTESTEQPVIGVLGFIPMGRFAPALGDDDVMLAIWKVRDRAPLGLGLRLLKFLNRELSPRLIGAIGTSEMVRPIYKVLGYQVGELHQSAVFRPGGVEGLRVASGVPNEAFAPAEPVPPARLALLPLDESSASELRAEVDQLGLAGSPAKNWDYLVHRYVRHPWYRYELRAVRQDGRTVAVVVWRLVEANGARVLRIVDIVGGVDWLRIGKHALQCEVTNSDAEYIDLMQWGIDQSVLDAGGFIGVGTHPGLVLPNYFSPFEARNIEIEIAFKMLDPTKVVRLFRADADQDRPNRVSDLEIGP